MKFKLKSNTLKGLLVHVSIAVGLFCLLCVAIFYGLLPALTNKDEIVMVPDLKWMSLEEASEFVTDKQLSVEVADSSYNSAWPPLTVLEQYPNPNARVKVNRKINLILNARIPPMVTYPDLSGSALDLAKDQLEMLDLRVRRVKYLDDIAHNAVLESMIDGNVIHPGERVRRGSQIDLVIGR